MLTRRLVKNVQFVGASLTLLLFAIGMMGALFMTVLAFVNLWGYSELKAALAITPIPIMGLLVAPVVGRLSNRIPPRVLAVPGLLSMSGGLFWLSAIPAEPKYTHVVVALALIGAGVGAMFPAVSIGSMGSIRGHELGLGPGIVNMSRQVGFAIGVALLVAVFTGTIGNNVAAARREVASLIRHSGLSPAQSAEVRRRVLVNPSDPSSRQRPTAAPETPIERGAQRIVDEHVRDSYGAAFRVAGLVTLLAIPFSLTMKKLPGQVEREDVPVAEPAVAAA